MDIARKLKQLSNMKIWQRAVLLGVFEMAPKPWKENGNIENQMKNGDNQPLSWNAERSPEDLKKLESVTSVQTGLISPKD